MARRLGAVLYLAACGAAALSLLCMVISIGSGARVTTSVLAFGAPAILIWLAGRAVRWILRAPY
jgi:hypothetical protein